MTPSRDHVYGFLNGASLTACAATGWIAYGSPGVTETALGISIMVCAGVAGTATLIACILSARLFHLRGERDG